ncbi:hypothetical protein U1Q18_050245 [Sarracenia purpurea var. burkii]
MDYDFSAPPFTGAFITVSQFQQWRCKNIENRYDDNVIRTKSGCTNKDGISVELEDEKGFIVNSGFPRIVGICYVSPTVAKCISKGAKQNSVFVYSLSYWSINSICHQPKQIDYDFSTTPATDKENGKIEASSASISSTPTAEEKEHVGPEKTSQFGTSSHSAISAAIKKENIKSAETPSSSSLSASNSKTNKKKDYWVQCWIGLQAGFANHN